MKTKAIIEKLRDEGYTLRLISTQAGVNYMRLWRFMRDESGLTEQEAAAITAFALIQPPFTRGKK